MSAYTDLSSTAQAGYAQVVDVALGAEHTRSVADLSGSFTSKQVKGYKYWYYQYTEPAGKLRQVFVGPDNETVRALVVRKIAQSATRPLALLAKAGALLVNVPHPARFALHKLLVAGERAGTFQAKASKDLRQVGALLEVLREMRAWEVDEAWQDLLRRGPGWISRVSRSLAMLDRLFPALHVLEWLRTAP